MSGSRWFGRFTAALGAAALGLLVTGCEPECVDPFDCAKKGAAGEGKRYACVDNRCVTQDADAGTTPADAGMDAGTDAGVSCTDLQHDPKLGTLQLHTGYAAAESAAIPEGIGAVTVVQSGSEYKLYGLRDTDPGSVADDSIYALGTWPNVALGAAPLHAVVPEPDRGTTTYPSGFLTTDGTRLLTGYTKAGTGFPGNVLVYDTATPANTTYFSAPGNLSAAGVSGAFLINALGIEGVNGSAAAIYALKTSSSPFEGSKLATFPATDASSGYTAVTTDKVAVLGYGVPDKSSSDPFAPFINHLLAVAPSVYSPAISGKTTLALGPGNAPEIYSGNDIKGVVGFGSGVALHRGTYTATHDVSRIEVTLGGITASTITAGDLMPVLTTPNNNTCTNVVSMTSIGPDLLVGVKDKNGRRLVRIQKQ